MSGWNGLKCHAKYREATPCMTEVLDQYNAVCCGPIDMDRWYSCIDHKPQLSFGKMTTKCSRCGNAGNSKHCILQCSRCIVTKCHKTWNEQEACNEKTFIWQAYKIYMSMISWQTVNVIWLLTCLIWFILFWTVCMTFHEMRYADVTPTIY